VTIISFFLNETYAPTLLKHKAAYLRKQHNDQQYQSKFHTALPAATVFKRAILRPMKLLFLSPIVSLLSLHLSMVYGYLYLLFTTFTMVFQGIYGFSTGAAGLTFLGLGGGSIAGVVIIGGCSDKIYLYYAGKNGGTGKPEYRLPFMVFSSLFCPIGLFWYGWSAQAHAHFMVPIIGSALMAFGMMSVMVRHPLIPCDIMFTDLTSPQLPVQNYLVDAYTQYAASAVAAATILRSLLGALLPLAGQPMYDKLGVGWGNSLLAFIALAFSPVPWFFWKYGERIRTRNPISLD